jgi:Zn-dependent M28 family amino/carboxypeptidase
MKKTFLAAFLGFVLTITALAQQPASYSAPQVERLRAHVAYLASGPLAGRRTGTDGANKAAAYLKQEFKKLSLEPAGTPPQNGKPPRYEQPFPYIAGVALGKGNMLALKPLAGGGKPVALRVGEDWQPLGFASNGKLENAPLVFAGYGVNAPELNRNDYAGLDVKGKVVVALAGAPDNDSKFGRHADARFKATAAKSQGAAALILLSQTDKFSDDRLSRLRYDNAGEAGLPVLALAKAAAARLGLADCASQTLPNGVKITPCGDTRASPQTDGKILLQKGQTAGPTAETWQKLTASLSLNLTRQTVAAENIVGVLPGNDANLKNEAIVIGAHYDHLGLGGEGSLATKEGEIHHGADDNASGTAGLLELERIFAQEKRNRRTLIFIAFSGEEEGLLGSIFYVNNPAWPLDKTIAMINMDMIGRMRDGKMTVGGIGTAQEFRPLIEQLNSNTPAAVANAKRFALALSEDGFGPSDHSSFYAKQIPVLFFFTGAHEDYHKPTDTAEKINYEDEARILQMVSEVVRALDFNDKRPTYTVAKSSGEGRRSQSFNVSLGVIPGYAESSDGMKLDGVREGSPAAKAGLKAGDKVIKMAGFDIKNVQDYTYALGQLKAGVEYEIVITRGAETLTLKITPVARR